MPGESRIIVYSATVRLTAHGDVVDYDVSRRSIIRAAFAEALAVAEASVTLDVRAASVLLNVRIAAGANESAAEAIATSLGAVAGSIASANALLANANVTVLSTAWPTVERSVEVVTPPPPPPSRRGAELSLTAGGLVLLIGGAILSGGLLSAVLWHVHRSCCVSSELQPVRLELNATKAPLPLAPPGSQYATLPAVQRASVCAGCSSRRSGDLPPIDCDGAGASSAGPCRYATSAASAAGSGRDPASPVRRQPSGSGRETLFASNYSRPWACSTESEEASRAGGSTASGASYDAAYAASAVASSRELSSGKQYHGSI